MKQILFLVLLSLFLAACAGTPVAAPAPTPTPLPSETPASTQAATPTPGATVAASGTPAPGETPAATATAAEKSYLEQLNITYSSKPVEVMAADGTDLLTTMQVNVDRSASSHGVNTIEIKPDTQRWLAARALHNLLLPQEEDTPENLAAFEKMLAEIQRGERPCSDLAKQVSMYTTTSTGPETLTLVPACGASAVPEGATAVKGVVLDYGEFYLNPEQGVFKPKLPGIEIISPAGDAAGMFAEIDPADGEAIIHLGS